MKKHIKKIDYIVKLLIIIVMFYYFHWVSRESLCLLDGYLTSMTISFVTGIVLLYRFVNTIFEDYSKKAEIEEEIEKKD